MSVAIAILEILLALTVFYYFRLLETSITQKNEIIRLKLIIKSYEKTLKFVDEKTKDMLKKYSI